jgi:hypothetical protein
MLGIDWAEGGRELSCSVPVLLALRSLPISFHLDIFHQRTQLELPASSPSLSREHSNSVSSVYSTVSTFRPATRLVWPSPGGTCSSPNWSFCKDTILP